MTYIKRKETTGYIDVKRDKLFLIIPIKSLKDKMFKDY